MAIDFHLYLNEAPHLNWQHCESLRLLARNLDRLSDEEFLSTGAHRRLFNAIRTVSGEPTLRLAQQTGLDCALDLIPYSVVLTGETRDSPFWQLSLETVEALIAGNPAHLFYCLRRQVAILEKSWDNWADIESNPGKIPVIGDSKRPEFQIASHRADRLAREILREIRLLKWTQGERIGTGIELMSRYKTTPDTLRQAILLLQEHGVVEAERGRTGGLYIAEPNRAKAIANAQTFLQRSGASKDKIRAFHFQLVLQSLEGFPRLDAKRLSNRAQACSQWLGQHKPGQAAPQFWQVAARLCDNPVLTLFTEVFAPFLTSFGRLADLQQMLTAVANGDLAQGRRLMLVMA